MSENNAEQMGQNVDILTTDNKEVQTAGGEPAKKVRVGYIFLSVIPVAVLIMIQSFCQLPFFFMAGYDLIQSGKDVTSDTVNFMEELITTFTDKYGLYAYLSYSVIALIVFFIWYFKGFVKKGRKVKLGEIFGFKSILASIGVVVGLNLAISAAFTLAFWFFPDAMNAYAKLVEQAGLGNNVMITVVYAIILGPVVEELCLRGVTYGFLEKSGIKPAFIILISGLLFGVMHLNLIQGIYASVLGFFLGFLRYKYRSILLPLVTHILFNLMGTYGDAALESIGMGDGVVLILGGLALFVLVFTVVLVNGDKKAVKSES